LPLPLTMSPIVSNGFSPLYAGCQPGRALLLAALLWFATGGMALHAQEANPISLADYQSVLADAVAQLAAADPADPTAAEAHYQRAHAALSRIERVELPAGDVVTVQPLLPPLPATDADMDDTDTDAGDASGAGNAPDLAALLQNGRARIELVQAQLNAAARDESTARLATLDQILARPEFAAQQTWWQRARAWLFDRLAELFPGAMGAESGSVWVIIGELVLWLLVVGGGLAIALLVSYWMQGLLGRFVREAAIQRRDAGDDDMPLTAEAARQQASSLAQSGDYRMAVRQLYLSALLTLEETGVIRHDRSLTNREVLAQIQARESQSEASPAVEPTTGTQPAAADGPAADTATIQSHLAPVIDTFDAVWYGVREPDRATFDSYAREIDSLSDTLQRMRASGRGQAPSRRTQSGEE